MLNNEEDFDDNEEDFEDIDFGDPNAIKSSDLEKSIPDIISDN